MASAKKTLEKQRKKSTVTVSTKAGKLRGEFWVWPDGRRTHLRFITMAVKRYKNLPKGFYAAAEKANRPNLNFLVKKAKSLGLEDNVLEP